MEVEGPRRAIDAKMSLDLAGRWPAPGISMLKRRLPLPISRGRSRVRIERRSGFFAR